MPDCSESGRKIYFKDNGDGKVKELFSKKIRLMFESKQVVCVEYHDLQEQDEREIFQVRGPLCGSAYFVSSLRIEQRVQLGMALTPAERFHAISGPIATFIRQLHTDLFGHNLSGTPLDLPLSRGADFRIVAEAVLLIDQLPSTGSLSAVKVQKWLGRETDLNDETKSIAYKMFTLLSEIANEKSLNQVYVKPTKMSPVELVFALVLFGIVGEGKTLAQNADLVGRLRKHARSLHSDIRANSSVHSTMVKFILSIPGARERMKIISSPVVSKSKRKRRGSIAEAGECQPKRENRV